MSLFSQPLIDLLFLLDVSQNVVVVEVHPADEAWHGADSNGVDEGLVLVVAVGLVEAPEDLVGTVDEAEVDSVVVVVVSVVVAAEVDMAHHGAEVALEVQAVVVEVTGARSCSDNIIFFLSLLSKGA